MKEVDILAKLAWLVVLFCLFVFIAGLIVGLPMALVLFAGLCGYGFVSGTARRNKAERVELLRWRAEVAQKFARQCQDKADADAAEAEVAHIQAKLALESPELFTT